MGDKDVVEHEFSGDPASVVGARGAARATAAWMAPAYADEIELVVSELATNAVLHASPPFLLRIRRRGSGVRVEVGDHAVDRAPAASGTGLAEVLALEVSEPGADDLLAVETMTGRGLLVVGAVADAWGVDVGDDRKWVWAEIGTGTSSAVRPPTTAPAADGNVLLAAVPARLVLASAANLDDVVREFRYSEDLGDLAEVAAELRARTAGVREPVRTAARQAVEDGRRLLDVRVAATASTVETLEHFLATLERIAEQCRSGALLSLAPDDEIGRYRRWYIDEIARQLDGAPPRACSLPAVGERDPDVLAAGAEAAHVATSPPLPLVTTTLRLLRAVDAAAEMDALGNAVVLAGRGALGAVNGSFLVADPVAHVVRIVWAHGYGDRVVGHWETFSLLDDLPASEAIRTGRAAFFRTARELQARFPLLAGAPSVGSAALAVVPAGRDAAFVLGFDAQRSFDAPTRRFLLDLGARAGAAVARLRA